MKKKWICSLIALTVFCGGCWAFKEPEASDTKQDAPALEHPQPAQKETEVQEVQPEEPVHPEPEPPKAARSSVKKLIQAAMLPVGQTLYTWGGGWNEEDTGGGTETVTLGISPEWKNFYSTQDGSYDYRSFEGLIHEGLDCAGYVGWALYNALETENGKESYVTTSWSMLGTLRDKGLGTKIPHDQVTEVHPGDLMYGYEHVYIVVYVFEDGSRLILHSSPPGVQFSGTPDASGNLYSMATGMADTIMSAWYPDYYARYPKVTTDVIYSDFDQFVWNSDIMGDLDAVNAMSIEEMIEYISTPDAS